MKKCPHCLQEVPDKATRCPHCTSFLEDKRYLWALALISCGIAFGTLGSCMSITYILLPIGIPFIFIGLATFIAGFVVFFVVRASESRQTKSDSSKITSSSSSETSENEIEEKGTEEEKAYLTSELACSKCGALLHKIMRKCPRCGVTLEDY